LKRIGDIESKDSFLSSNSGIVIYKKMNRDHGDAKIELIRFNIMSLNPFDNGNGNINGNGNAYSNNNTEFATSEERDDILENLQTVVEWDRERRKSQPTVCEEEDNNDDDNESSNRRGTGLGQRALKAKYFIQKEIEMKKQTKDRESRKARYMKDSGGLKYTALAMANREIS
jgi:hypothetical protein